MARRRRRRLPGEIIPAIAKELERCAHEYEELSVRERVSGFANLYSNVKDLGVNMLPDRFKIPWKAQARILIYLREHVGQIVEGAELEVVAGISEYARRIRELRVQEGYQIATGDSPDPAVGVDLNRDQYLLLSAVPDSDLGSRWKIANRIRRTKKGSQQKILEFFMENVNKVVTTEELAYVSGEKREFARRVRELRTEEGYSIATRFTGRPDLKVGQYVLQSLERVAQTHDRKISAEDQKKVYDRDNNTCKLCGWNMEKWRKEDPRILELHHLEHHAAGGENKPDNLIVICSRCHDEVHAGRLEIPF